MEPRIGRIKYAVAWFGIICICNSLIKATNESGSVLGGVFFLLMGCISILEITRYRCDDAGISGRKKTVLSIASAIPFITTIPFVYLLFKPSTPEREEEN